MSPLLAMIRPIVHSLWQVQLGKLQQADDFVHVFVATNRGIARVVATRSIYIISLGTIDLEWKLTTQGTTDIVRELHTTNIHD